MDFGTCNIYIYNDSFCIYIWGTLVYILIQRIFVESAQNLITEKCFGWVQSLAQNSCYLLPLPLNYFLVPMSVIQLQYSRLVIGLY